MDNNEFDDYSDNEEGITEKHLQLLKSVKKLDNKPRIIKPERNEPTLQVSEFHLINSGVTDNDAVCVDDLVKTLNGRTHHKVISKKFNITKQQGPVLPKPLEKPIAEKLKRAVGFENTTKQLEKWNAIITRNRVAPEQVFPLNQPSMRMKPSSEFVKRFRIQSKLEEELSALEEKEPNVDSAKINEFSLTLNEIKQKRLEAAKFRAQQSYKHAKASRQKKIKSKKFHRIEKIARVKEQLKEFAKLQEVDPEGALEKIEQLNRARAEERMSLKHKNTSQWAKNKQIRAKYDKQSREALAQQLSISRELMQKVNESNNSDEELSVNNIEVAKVSGSSLNNPWINNEKTRSEVDEFIANYHTYQENKHKVNQNNETSKEQPKEPCNLSKKQTTAVKNPVVEIIQQNTNKNKKNVNGKKISKLAVQKKIDLDVIEKVGTSEWSVEVLHDKKQLINNDANNSIILDDMFHAVENNMKQKFDKKINRIKRKLLETTVKEYEDDDSNHDLTDLSFKKTKIRSEIDEPLDETAGEYNHQDLTVPLNNEFTKNMTSLKSECVNSKNSVEINPNNFIIAKSQCMKNQPTNCKEKVEADSLDISDDDDDDDDQEEEKISQQNIISEAFADDGVVDEFKKEKAEENEKSQLDNTDTQLPGWGSWSNKISQPNKKSMKSKRRFILKFPEDKPRNDENKGNVILIQDNSIIKKHQVHDVPYPFNSVSDFETSIRAPLGRNFITENAYKQSIEPAIKTKMGKIIDPMDEEALFNKKNLIINKKLSKSSNKYVTKKNKNIK